MKKIFILVLGMILISTAASAQSPKPFTVYGSLGLTFSNGPEKFQDLHKMGYDFYFGLGFKFIPFVQVVGKIEKQQMKKDWEFVAPGILSGTGLSGGTVSIWMYGLDARLTIGAPLMPIKPFLIAGGGWAKMSEGAMPAVGLPFYDYLDTGTKFYYNIGGGLDFGTGPFSFFIQGRYINIKQDGENLTLIPVNVGIKF